MSLRCLGLIGAGSIARELLTVLARSLPEPLTEICILVRPGRALCLEGLSVPADRLRVVESLEALVAAAPNLVLECAGHEAVRCYAEPLLAQGIDCVLVSSGALGDAELLARLRAAALKSQAQFTIPAGAIGAMDVLAGIRHASVDCVTYVSRKPPHAWRGTPAEALIDLDAIRQETVFYEGSARQAALDYPKNANVAATVALTGIGFERTRVRLIADPLVSANIHALEVQSDAAVIALRIEGRPSPANPKTSLPTVYSLVREVMRRCEPLVI